MTFSFGSNTNSFGSGGFGATTKTNTFGTSTFGATSKPSGFGSTGFGSTSGFGSTGFGAATKANTFSFGSTSTASSGFGGFGAKPVGTATAFNFGGASSTTTTTNSLFSGFGTTTTTSSLFGGFGNKSTFSTGSGFGGFGTNTGLSGGLGSSLTTNTAQQQQQQQQQVPDNPISVLTNVLTLPSLFGDERDSILAKLNQLQALWGHGKGYYSAGAQPIHFTMENPFCRFRSIGYSCLPSAKDSDGLVSIELSHKQSYVKDNLQQFVEAIHKLLGNKNTLSVCVDGVSMLPSDKSEATIYVMERQANGTSRRILASELYAFLSQQSCQNQLKTMGVENIIAKTEIGESQMKKFLDNTPLGIEDIIWEQAKKDNPDPKNLIPVPMFGFSELHMRLKHQENQSSQQTRRLELISEEIDKLKTLRSSMNAKIAQYKRKQIEIAHRILEVMINGELQRKSGCAITQDEEQLRIQFESIHAELNAPLQCKGRLNELLSQIHLQSRESTTSLSSIMIDETTKADVKQHLLRQQEGLMKLIAIVKEDIDDIKIIENGIFDSISRR